MSANIRPSNRVEGRGFITYLLDSKLFVCLDLDLTGLLSCFLGDESNLSGVSVRDHPAMRKGA
jgi:hypothetical protein